MENKTSLPTLNIQDQSGSMLRLPPLLNTSESKAKMSLSKSFLPDEKGFRSSGMGISPSRCVSEFGTGRKSGNFRFKVSVRDMALA